MFLNYCLLDLGYFIVVVISFLVGRYIEFNRGNTGIKFSD